jgi:hypothetical protein
LIIDYLDLKQLQRVSRVSKGIYWLTGNPLILAKFQISSKELNIEQFELHPLTPKQLQHKARIRKAKYQGSGIFGPEFQKFRKSMDQKFF